MCLLHCATFAKHVPVAVATEQEGEEGSNQNGEWDCPYFRRPWLGGMDGSATVWLLHTFRAATLIQIFYKNSLAISKSSCFSFSFSFFNQLVLNYGFCLISYFLLSVFTRICVFTMPLMKGCSHFHCSGSKMLQAQFCKLCVVFMTIWESEQKGQVYVHFRGS